MRGDISFVDLARLCGMYEPDLRRTLRFAMCYHHAFAEHRKGYVSHSAVSRAIVEKKGAKDALGVMFDECWQSYARVSLCYPIEPYEGSVSMVMLLADRRGHGAVS